MHLIHDPQGVRSLHVFRTRLKVYGLWVVESEAVPNCVLADVKL
jgi:hypothetical protein